MCCIVIECCTWVLDVFQRIFQFTMAMTMCLTISLLLLVSVAVGISYGYNYSLVEYIYLKDPSNKIFSNGNEKKYENNHDIIPRDPNQIYNAFEAYVPINFLKDEKAEMDVLHSIEEWNSLKSGEMADPEIIPRRTINSFNVQRKYQPYITDHYTVRQNSMGVITKITYKTKTSKKRIFSSRAMPNRMMTRHISEKPFRTVTNTMKPTTVTNKFETDVNELDYPGTTETTSLLTRTKNIGHKESPSTAMFRIPSTTQFTTSRTIFPTRSTTEFKIKKIFIAATSNIINFPEVTTDIYQVIPLRSKLIPKYFSINKSTATNIDNSFSELSKERYRKHQDSFTVATPKRRITADKITFTSFRPVDIFSGTFISTLFRNIKATSKAYETTSF